MQYANNKLSNVLVFEKTQNNRISWSLLIGLRFDNVYLNVGW